VTEQLHRAHGNLEFGDKNRAFRSNDAGDTATVGTQEVETAQKKYCWKPVPNDVEGGYKNKGGSIRLRLKETIAAGKVRGAD